MAGSDAIAVFRLWAWDKRADKNVRATKVMGSGESLKLAPTRVGRKLREIVGGT